MAAMYGRHVWPLCITTLPRISASVPHRRLILVAKYMFSGTKNAMEVIESR